jgi:hypothetical protein
MQTNSIMSHELVYNSYINTRERNSQLTEAFVERIISDIILAEDLETGETFEDRKEKEQTGWTNDDKITNFLLKAIKEVDTSCIKPCILVRSSAAVYMEAIVNGHFDIQTCTWRFVVCLFACLKEIVYNAYQDAGYYGCGESYVASSNVLCRDVVDAICRIDDWVLQNNGWMALLDNFDPSMAADAEMKTLLKAITWTVAHRV